MTQPPYIVIGAGIAGLAAAHTLQAAGHQVCVLEAAERPGGRTWSVDLGSQRLDCGTQFITADYRHILRLIDAVDLTNELVPFEPWMGLVRPGGTVSFNINDAWQFLRSGVLTPGQWLRLLPQAGAFLRAYLKRETDDYGAWHRDDTSEAHRWVVESFGADLDRDLFEPLVESLFFHPTTHASKATLLAFTRFFRRRFYTLQGGLGSLTEALAARLDVRYGEAVTGLNVASDGVEVTTTKGCYWAQHVVLATTASVARKLYTQADPLEQALMACAYAPSLTLHLRLDPTFAHPWFDHHYGVMLPDAQRQYLAALTVDRRFAHDDRRRVVSLYTTQRSAELLAESDEVIRERLLQEAERLMPGLHRSVVETHLSKWTEAIPHSRVGRSERIHAYHRQLQTTPRRVVLAGDYLGLTDFNSAAYTGIFAAQTKLHSSR